MNKIFMDFICRDPFQFYMIGSDLTLVEHKQILFLTRHESNFIVNFLDSYILLLLDIRLTYY